MIVGFNSDVKYRNEVFHIQTEDKGNNNPTIETLVYHKGEILLSRRLSYTQFLKIESLTKKVRSMMKTQHNQIIADIGAAEDDPTISCQIYFAHLRR